MRNSTWRGYVSARNEIDDSRNKIFDRAGSRNVPITSPSAEISMTVAVDKFKPQLENHVGIRDNRESAAVAYRS